MNQIGWSLIDSSGNELQHWGDILGQCAGVPDMVPLPNGERVHCPQPGALGDWRLVPRMAQRGPGPTSFDGTQVVASFPVTAADVRSEAQRRIIVLTGATDFNGCVVKQMNALMRATELANKRATGATLTELEETEAAALQAMADGIKAIRAFSNAMEENPPTDFADNERWTA